MRSLAALAALLVWAVLSSSAQAQCCYIPPPKAPDMCQPPQYYPGHDGGVYGWYVYPPFAPFNGMVSPAPWGGGGGGGGGGAGAGFITHRFARSPRDYFMIEFGPRNPPY
jgi:hypothetical protein